MNNMDSNVDFQNFNVTVSNVTDGMPMPCGIRSENVITEADYYELYGEDMHVELIGGLLYNMAPPGRIHQRILGLLFQKIENYIESSGKPCEAYPAPFGVKLFPDEDGTIVEPDISVICDRKKLTDKGCLGAPDWIIEIVSPGNPQHDYLEKLNLYKRAGVREYWIVNPIQKNIIVYTLDEGNFSLCPYTFNDRIKAGIYEDLWIDFPSISKRIIL